MRSSLASFSSSRKRFKISTSFSEVWMGWLDAMGVPGGCMSFHHFAGSVGSFLFRWFLFKAQNPEIFDSERDPQF